MEFVICSMQAFLKPAIGERHNALDDAIHQAKYVSAIWHQLIPATSK